MLVTENYLSIHADPMVFILCHPRIQMALWNHL